MTAPDTAALHRLTIAELTQHPELQRFWRDTGAGDAATAFVVDYFAHLDGSGRLTVPDPATSARQFVLLLAVEAHVRSLYGVHPLSEDELAGICRDTVELILRAHDRR